MDLYKQKYNGSESNAFHRHLNSEMYFSPGFCSLYINNIKKHTQSIYKHIAIS